jgi:hypothetical protein
MAMRELNADVVDRGKVLESRRIQTDRVSLDPGDNSSMDILEVDS